MKFRCNSLVGMLHFHAHWGKDRETTNIKTCAQGNQTNESWHAFLHMPFMSLVYSSQCNHGFLMVFFFDSKKFTEEIFLAIPNFHDFCRRWFESLRFWLKFKLCARTSLVLSYVRKLLSSREETFLVNILLALRHKYSEWYLAYLER